MTEPMDGANPISRILRRALPRRHARADPTHSAAASSTTADGTTATSTTATSTTATSTTATSAPADSTPGDSTPGDITAAPAPAPPNWRALSHALDRHFQDLPILRPAYPENVARVAALERDGIVFIDNLFDADAMARMRADLAAPMQAIRQNSYDGLGVDPDYLHLFPELGRFRIYRIDRLAEQTRRLIDHPVLRDMVDAYMSGHTHWIDLALEQRRPPPDLDRALGDLMPHSDHVFREVKIYLALEDITDDNGPIIYWTGTHRRAAWRQLPDYLASIGGLWAESSNILNHNSVGNLMARSPEFADCREVRCTIKAGSAFACDTRGQHRASYLKAGERWHIYATYGIDGYVRRPIPNDNWLQPLDLG